MNLAFRKTIFAFIFHSCLFALLMIGIQNNSNKNKVNLIIDNTIDLPIGFIVGASFISGSLLGGLIDLKFFNSK